MDYFIDYFENDEEYPNNIAERGVAENTLYTYVSSTFIEGFINYVKPFYVVAIERYEDSAESILFKEEIKNKPHTDYSNAPDDILILAESENDYWFFWDDKDCSDCCIGRFKKNDVNKLKVILSLQKWLKNELHHDYIEMPLPNGWITF